LDVTGSNKYIANNIIVSGGCLDTSEGYFYNMCNLDQLPSDNGNIQNTNMNSVFVDPANYDYHLLQDSPAKGAGQNGEDMGCYGGDTPFVDGGAPGIPSIVEITASHVGSQQSGLDVIIKAKSNKE